MRDNKKVNWMAGVVTVAAGAWLGLFLLPFPPGIDTRLHEAVGETLAAEAIKLSDPGSRVIMLARDTVEFQVPATVAQLNGLQRALKNAGRQPAVPRVFKADPLRVVEVPPGDFLELLRQAKETDVFISFLGPPNLADGQIAKLDPNKRPKVIALCTGPLPRRVDLKRAFTQKVLHAAVVDRPDAPAQARPGEAHVAFAQLFSVITPANVAELDALLTTSKD